MNRRINSKDRRYDNLHSRRYCKSITLFKSVIIAIISISIGVYFSTGKLESDIYNSCIYGDKLFEVNNKLFSCSIQKVEKYDN